MPRVTPAQRKVREAEIAYAVKALEQDPHVVVYIDAGASDTLITPRRYARMLKASDVAQAQGFSVNSTHHEWVTSEIHFGQQISRYLGGAHFVVQSGSAGRGPALNPHPKTQGVEDLCNPSGTGLGPLTWNTGYKGVDGLLWYANVGFTANIPCHDGEPGLATFWPEYAYGIVKRRVNTDHRTEIPADQVRHGDVTGLPVTTRSRDRRPRRRRGRRSGRVGSATRPANNLCRD